MLKQYLITLFLAAFFVRTLCAQAPAIIEGSVVNKLTGAPVKGAYVIYNKTDAELRGASSFA